MARERKYWVDDLGVRRPVPYFKSGGYQTPNHYALRAFIHRRDGFACRTCGVKAIVPEGWHGQWALRADAPPRYKRNPYKRSDTVPVLTEIVIDHILSRRNGGTFHPSNLQTLCSSCNSRKASQVDARHGR